MRTTLPPEIDEFKDPEHRYSVSITGDGISLGRVLTEEYNDEELGSLVRKLMEYAHAFLVSEQLYMYSDPPSCERNAARKIAERYERLDQDKKDFLGEEAYRNYLRCLGRPVESEQSNDDAKTQERHETETGVVYVAESETGHFKIGRSQKPADRIKHFDTQMPVDVDEVHRFECDAYRRAENKLHEWASDHRVKGEWFNLTDDMLSALKRIDRYEKPNFYDGEGNVISRFIESRLADG